MDQLIDGLRILATYGARECDLYASHDCLVCGKPDPDKVDEVNIERLDKLGWLVGEDHPDCFMKFI